MGMEYMKDYQSIKRITLQPVFRMKLKWENSMFHTEYAYMDSIQMFCITEAEYFLHHSRYFYTFHSTVYTSVALSCFISLSDNFVHM